MFESGDYFSMAQTARAYATDVSDFDSDQMRLIEAWRHEFLHVAMMTAFVTMSYMAAVEQGNASRLEDVEAQLPDEPAIDRAIQQGLFEIAPQFDAVLQAAKVAYDDLYAAMALFSAAQERSRRDGRGQQPLIWCSAISDLWRVASASFLHALGVFERSGLLHPASVANNRLGAQCPKRVVELLRAARAGKTLASSGAGASPRNMSDWAQRRRWARRDFNMKCGVEAKGAYFNALIRNVSLGGALLDGVQELPRGTRVSVTTEGGRKLHAAVMWCRDKTAGIKFDEQLHFNDPLVEPVGN
jgi:hypothetical protein